MDSKVNSCSEANLLTWGVCNEMLKTELVFCFILTFRNAKSILHLRGE